jgi:uncharacterized protein YyaL (SSP411 family)
VFFSRSTILSLGLVLVSAPTIRAAEQLRGAASAFLRAHVESPVNWLPWGEAAFAQAKREQKPVYLAIGAFGSELSQAMRTQTFGNSETADFLNKNFVCVLVDREEHPELAALYQAYVKTKQLSGWPLNLWLTPELQPFEGTTYLPPSEEWGKPGFLKVAQPAAQAWAADPAACRKRAAEAVTLLADPFVPFPSGVQSAEKSRGRLSVAAEAWRAHFDATNGGFSEPPKNPEPELLRFLLRQAPADREAALTTLRALTVSALRDPLDGGFFRSATDPAWRVPYPQKMLADQARLALAFLDAASGNETKDAKLFTAAARGALDYVLARLAQPDGTFAAMEDGTAEEFAGYYAWTATEIEAALGQDAAAFKAAHGVEAAGNVSADMDASGRFTGKNLLRSAAVENRAALERLRAIRDRRPALPRDDRATAQAHGLLLAALARAGGPGGEARYLTAATRLFDALKKEFLISAEGELRHLRGSAAAATPADYAAVALGAREFAKASERKEADALASRLLAVAANRFFDAASGRYYATPATLPPGIFARPPAWSEAPSAESLTLLAGAPAEQTRAIAAALGAMLDETDTAPGDVLLALALSP